MTMGILGVIWCVGVRMEGFMRAMGMRVRVGRGVRDGVGVRVASGTWGRRDGAGMNMRMRMAFIAVTVGGL